MSEVSLAAPHTHTTSFRKIKVASSFHAVSAVQVQSTFQQMETQGAWHDGDESFEEESQGVHV